MNAERIWYTRTHTETRAPIDVVVVGLEWVSRSLWCSRQEPVSVLECPSMGREYARVFIDSDHFTLLLKGLSQQTLLAAIPRVLVQCDCSDPHLPTLLLILSFCLLPSFAAFFRNSKAEEIDSRIVCQKLCCFCFWRYRWPRYRGDIISRNHRMCRRVLSRCEFAV